jgi:enoyl-[acyl-carrier protein] reductase II
MLRTGLCDVLGVDLPIVLAPFGPWDEVELAAAVAGAFAATPRLRPGGGD